MIPCVRFKDGVRLDPMTPALARLLTAVDMTARMQGVDLTVTCGREFHALTDPHTRGAAIDVRVTNLNADKIVTSYHYLRSLLGDLFTVLFETPHAWTEDAIQKIAFVNAAATAPHFHIQVKKDTIYPPQDVAGAVTV